MIKKFIRKILGVKDDGRDPTQPVILGPEEHKIDPRNVSRNAPCPCGSGKKYKHCHGRTA